MGLDAKDIEKLMQLTALITQGIAEVNNIIESKKKQTIIENQPNKTQQEIEEELFNKAEIANKKAKELIDAL